MNIYMMECTPSESCSHLCNVCFLSMPLSCVEVVVVFHHTV
jgi:hypothetical protein